MGKPITNSAYTSSSENNNRGCCIHYKGHGGYNCLFALVVINFKMAIVVITFILTIVVIMVVVSTEIIVIYIYTELRTVLV